MTENNDELQIIKTVGENGEEVELKLLDIISVNNLDYALLIPADEEENEDSEVVLMRLRQSGEEYIFETIEDDDEFNEVAKIISEEDLDSCECGCECGTDCKCGDDNCACN